MADEVFELTQEGYDSLQEQLRAYEQEIESLRSELYDIHDDPGSNLDADEAGAFYQVRTDMENALNRVGHIKFVLERAVVQQEDPDPRRVDPGERVTVWDFTEGRERVFDILVSPEVELTYARDNHRRQVSADSPVGQALVGRRIGDIVEIDVPDGRTRLAIRRIERPSQE